MNSQHMLHFGREFAAYAPAFSKLMLHAFSKSLVLSTFPFATYASASVKLCAQIARRKPKNLRGKIKAIHIVCGVLTCNGSQHKQRQPVKKICKSWLHSGLLGIMLRGSCGPPIRLFKLFEIASFRHSLASSFLIAAGRVLRVLCLLRVHEF